MANDYKPLNRNQTWTVAQTAAIKKVFVRGIISAAAGDHNAVGFTRADVHQIINPYLDGNEAEDISRLCTGIRTAIVAANSSYDSIQHITGFRMSQIKKKIIKNLADSTIAAIV